MDWPWSIISVHTGKRSAPIRGGRSLHLRGILNSWSRVVKPAPGTSSQLSGWETLPPGMSKLPVSPTRAAAARWFCTPLVWWTTGVELGIMAAGLVVA